ncbi:MAG: NlpC/P60 family protein [Thermodesulfovibrionales bacterium]|nr:NlpC/P60 family protein [Thermodesulfovibrionales bacterium]
MRKVVIAVIVSLLRIATTSFGNDTYSVQKGDNLYSISKRFNVPLQDLMNANKLENISLKIGQSLIIPKSTLKSASTSNTATIKTQTNSDSSSKTSNNTKTPTFHIVKKGDNIYRISKNYGISIEDIKEINNLSSNSLKIGQKLSLVKTNSLSDSFSSGDTELDTIRSAYHKRKPPVINENKINEAQDLAKAEDISNLDIQERIILFAKKLLHLPYTFGGSGAFGIDCSGFVQKVYKIAGINLPRSAREQFRHGELVDKEELEKGDLVFFRTYASFPSHVGIYLGNNLFIHASTLSKKVTIDSMDTPYYVKRYIGAKRLLSDEEVKNLDLPNLKNN